jgi:hypothetical protein
MSSNFFSAHRFSFKPFASDAKSNCASFGEEVESHYAYFGEGLDGKGASKQVLLGGFVLIFLSFEITNGYDDNDGNSDSTDHGTAVMVAIEFHGDDFVFDEIRRVTGSAVAVAKGFH